MAKKPPGNGIHKVKKGEWVASIADVYGYADWEGVVWEHEKNAALHEKRPDPHVLKEGDELFMPPWDEREESASTGQRNTFKTTGSDEVLRVRLLTPDGTPRANEKYRLVLVHDDNTEEYSQQNKETGPDGQVEEKIPHTVKSAKLTIESSNEELKFNFGHLSPLDQNDKPTLIKGVQQRLKALGFEPGEINGKDSEATTGAVKAFQAHCRESAGSAPGLIDAGEPDGTMDDGFVKALLSYYGC